MKFRAWYADGGTHDGVCVDDFKALPAEGVLVIVVYRDTGRTVYAGGDWYYWRDGAIGYVPSSEWGTEQPRPDIDCRDCVKRGVGVTDEEFAVVYGEASRG